MKELNIHQTAIVSKFATIGDGVTIGPFSIIHDHVEIRAGTVIGGHCEIGVETPLAKSATLVIGKNSHIRSHCVFYQGSTFGDNLRSGHHAVVRENTVAGEAFQVGSFADIQGDCMIGDYVRSQSHVFIGKTSKIGNYIWLLPYVVLTNDPHPPSEYLIGPEIKDYAILAAKAVVLPGVVVNEHALVAAGSVVKNDVPAHMVCAGVPARTIGPTSKIKLRDNLDQSAYPWTTHFHRDYPEDIVERWRQTRIKDK